jgi:hypothetical protein
VKSKFVIFQTPDGEQAVIFPSETFFHDEMASHFSTYEVVSAGFVSINQDGKIECSGRSTSLDIESRGEDDEIIIERQLRERRGK